MDRTDTNLVIYVEREQIAYTIREKSGYIGIQYSGDIPGRVKDVRITWGIGSVWKK